MRKLVEVDEDVHTRYFNKKLISISRARRGGNLQSKVKVARIIITDYTENRADHRVPGCDENKRLFFFYRAE